ncbi:hypothetical protein A1O1_06247 [Capronia coronata CBS 617.96]|uniref:Uncharacterized protein n=1 Tax=Capronia coronata CBS 617.96 TaxID=1182541 RepID=W9Y097_9EURO|nr:uncharacterized protein A1O1_06247 [Capronia coronata CBS 617.96]EXJ85878.1 hypothetical protein A1O1_06247 [Capronia coronata CBS 617.96]
MKSLNTQLKKKGLEMVEEYVDPEFGPVYTIHAVKGDVSNNDVAYRLYYAGEVTKWSASRRKAIEKASNRVKAAKAKAERELERAQSQLTESTRSSPSTS